MWQRRMEWISEQILLLGRNRTEIRDGHLSCQIIPSDSDIAEFRADPERYTALTKWLMLGGEQDAKLINKFQHIPDMDGLDIIEDKGVWREVCLDWLEHQIKLLTTNTFDECTIRKFPVKDFATIWMAYEKGAKYPDSESAFIWITDWKDKKMYQKAGYVVDAFAGGDLSLAADIVGRFSDTSVAFSWAKARAAYDLAYRKSLGDFNPIV